MAGGNKKGPDERGPMTGRGLGYCAGNDHAGFEAGDPPAGRGGGFGRRFGSGHGRGRGRGAHDAWGGGNGYGRGFGRGYGVGEGRGNRWRSRNADRRWTGSEESPATPKLRDEIVSLQEQIRVLADRIETLAQDD